LNQGETLPSAHTSSISRASKYGTSVYVSGQGALENVGMIVKYEIIEEPENISVAEKFIKAYLPAPASLSRESQVDWLSTNISVLRIIIELSNNKDTPVYYITNAFYSTYYRSSNDSKYTLFNWKINHPIAIPKIIPHNGSVFPIPIMCTLDLRYEKILPHNEVTNEYYFIITKPFNGTIKAAATVCIEPFSNTCTVLEGNIPFTINNN
jgi:hypothetical protein